MSDERIYVYEAYTPQSTGVIKGPKEIELYKRIKANYEALEADREEDKRYDWYSATVEVTWLTAKKGTSRVLFRSLSLLNDLIDETEKKLQSHKDRLEKLKSL